VNIAFVAIGENIRKFQKAKSLMQTELAEKLGTTHFVITNLVRSRNNPTGAKLPDIAKALDLPLEALWGISEKILPNEKRVQGRGGRQRFKRFFEGYPPPSNWLY
jgi:transcriptional regulator with XRE-family HTH domain